MNFLAHAYLSGENPGIVIGNLMGDTVKGKQYESYPHDIKTGLLMHRSIDSFTDTQTEVKASVETVRPAFGRYSGIVCDIYYDHFLAKHWSDFSKHTLADFAQSVYLNLNENLSILPPVAQRISAFMMIRNWLGTYDKFDFLHQVFLGMNYRTSKKGNMDVAVEVLQEHYETLEAHFFQFMPKVESFSKDYLEAKMKMKNRLNR